MNIRAKYERRKKEFRDKKTKEAQMSAQEKQMKEKRVTEQEYFEVWRKFGLEIEFSSKGLPEIASLDNIAQRELGVITGKEKLGIMRKKFVLQYPDFDRRKMPKT